MKSRAESLIRLKKFQVDEKRRQVAQIEMMIADFERMASELDQQIEIEQQKTGISDVAHFAYSTFAKAAIARRDNLEREQERLYGQEDPDGRERHATGHGARDGPEYIDGGITPPFGNATLHHNVPVEDAAHGICNGFIVIITFD